MYMYREKCIRNVWEHQFHVVGSGLEIWMIFMVWSDLSLLVLVNRKKEMTIYIRGLFNITWKDILGV